MFFEPLLTGDVWWLVVNKRRRRDLLVIVGLQGILFVRIFSPIFLRTLTS
jgi:hypothetical protein